MFEEEAKEWADKVCPCDGQARRYLLTGAWFGYNKATEWHYVEDGEYPTSEKDVQVLYQDCDKIKVYNCVYDVHAKNWLYHNLDNMVLELFPFTVIAWKEIILPEELKERIGVPTCESI
jgi:hypothetical protein